MLRLEVLSCIYKGGYKSTAVDDVGSGTYVCPSMCQLFVGQQCKERSAIFVKNRHCGKRTKLKERRGREGGKTRVASHAIIRYHHYY